MNADTILARVHEALDARCDPLDDAVVVAWVEAHPEWLPTIAGLRDDARGLAAVAARPLPRSRLRPRAVAGLLAATALVALTLHAARAVPAAPAAGRILSAQLVELRPRAHLAAAFVAESPLVATTTSRLVTWQTHSERR